jgi:hypothetical protein
VIGAAGRGGAAIDSYVIDSETRRIKDPRHLERIRLLTTAAPPLTLVGRCLKRATVR